MKLSGGRGEDELQRPTPALAWRGAFACGCHYNIGLSGFTHIVAGSTVIFFAAISGITSWRAYWIGFFMPTLLGNIIGGVSLVAALARGQVVGGKTE